MVIELIKSLISKILKLFETKCVCMSREDYDKLVQELEEVNKKLEEWMRQVEMGVIGVEVRESN